MSMTFGVDASQNYKVWGNVQPVTLVSVTREQNIEFKLGPVKRRAPTFKELAPSGGVYTSQDVVWLLPKTLMDPIGATVKPGDRISEGETDWTVLECPLNTLRSTFRCMTRDLILAFDLRATLSVKRPAATVTTDNAGGRTYSYETVYEDIPCRFQETASETRDERGKRLTIKRFTVWVGERLYLGTEDRIVDEDANVYELIASHDADRIDQLQSLEVELRWATN